MVIRVLITGGSGFIGSHVQRRLTSEYEVVVLDRHAGTDATIERRVEDVRDAALVDAAVAEVDAVIHLAGLLGTQENVDDPRPAVETNVLGSLNVLDACRRHGRPGVFLAVGNWWMNNGYSISKHAAERFVEMYRDEHGTHVANVRAVNVYGPGQRASAPFGDAHARKIMPSFICRAISRLPVEVFGSGRQVSDCVHVVDVADALVATLMLLLDGRRIDRTIEVGPTMHHTVNEIAELVVRSAESDSPIVHLPMRPGEHPDSHVVADTATLDQIGLDPMRFVPLTDGVERTIAWFREHEGTAWRRPRSHVT